MTTLVREVVGVAPNTNDVVMIAVQVTLASESDCVQAALYNGFLLDNPAAIQRDDIVLYISHLRWSTQISARPRESCFKVE